MRRALALLFFAVLAACAWAQESTALRTPRYDPSLLGDVIEASELWDFTDDEKRPGYAKGIGLTPTNWPYQNHAVDVYEPWSALTFVAWVYRDNLPENWNPVVGITVYPLARKRAPCETFLRVPQGVGSVVFEGVAKPAGVSTNNVGTVAYNLTCDAAVTVDFGGGESKTHEAGAYRDVEIKAAVDGDVTVTTDAETVWTLYAGTPGTAKVGNRAGFSPTNPHCTVIDMGRWCFVMHTLRWTEKGLVMAGRSWLPTGVAFSNSDADGKTIDYPIGHWWVPFDGSTVSTGSALPRSETQVFESVGTGPMNEGAARIVPFQIFNYQGHDPAQRPDQTKPSVLKLIGVRRFNRILTNAEALSILKQDVAVLKRRGILTDKDFEPVYPEVPGFDPETGEKLPAETTAVAASAALRAPAATALLGVPPRPLTEEEAEAMRKEAMR